MLKSLYLKYTYWPFRLVKAASKRIKFIKMRITWHFHGYGAVNQKLFEGKHNGETCTIICNGPSIKQTNMDLVRSHYTFSLNRAYLAFESWGFTPDYYVCVNELVLDQFSADIDKIETTKFVNLNKLNKFRSENTHPIFLKFSDTFAETFNEPFSTAATVTFVSLQIAMLMGFKKIIIVGLDHSFSGNGKANQTLKSADEDKNHFLGNYFAGGTLWEYPDLNRNEIGYEIIKKEAKKMNIEIIDCTPNGKCPIFTKGVLENELVLAKN